MINEIKQFITENELITEKNTIVFAAVSGGIDSCVMLDILTKLRADFYFKLQIIHFNHNTRGKENKLDENFVDDLSEKYALPIKIKRMEISTIKKSEVFLRDQRYKYFNHLLALNKGSVIATAHNLDDNVETFLMRLLRGSHIKGLTGIKPKRGRFIRPLLSQTRHSIRKYAKTNKIAYREDLSNRDDTYTRNNIRNKIIPYLNKSTGFKINANIMRSITDLNQYYSFFLRSLENTIKNAVKKTNHGIVLNKLLYRKSHTVIRKGLIEYCISMVQPLNYGISTKNYYQWDDFVLNSTSGKKKNILNSGYAISERKEVIFGEFPLEVHDEEYRLKLNSDLVIGNKKIIFEEIDQKSIKYTSNKFIEYIDGEKSGKNLIIRHWRKGDSFYPLGMKNKRKLSDFFIDLKLSARKKRETLLVCKNDKIIWIAGLRLGDHFKISDNTKKIYKIELHRTDKNV